MSEERVELRLERGSRQVLIADDSATYRAVAARVLQDAGYRVATVADGAEALERLQTGSRVHVLVLELNLPRVRGLDLLRRIRESAALARLPVIAVSEVVGEHLKRVLSDLKLDASLSKSHALRDLLWQVDQLAFPEEADERKSPRRLLKLPVNYWVNGRLCLESCFDLSEIGMFLAVADEAPPPRGTALKLRFWLPIADRLIGTDAEVVWVNTVEGDLRISHPPGMGVSFTALTEADRALIREYLDKGAP